MGGWGLRGAVFSSGPVPVHLMLLHVGPYTTNLYMGNIYNYFKLINITNMLNIQI